MAENGIIPGPWAPVYGYAVPAAQANDGPFASRLNYWAALLSRRADELGEDAMPESEHGRWLAQLDAFREEANQLNG